MADCTCPRVDGYRIKRQTCPVHGVEFPQAVKEATGEHKTPADYWDEGWDAGAGWPQKERGDNPYR